MCLVNLHEIYKTKTAYRSQVYDICGTYSPMHYNDSSGV